jgi:protein-S-isoprenylcysteine O-methyltransferase Ste14
MTRSRSTPRIRFTQALYVLVVLVVPVASGQTFSGLGGATAQLAGLFLVSVAAVGRLWTSLFIAGRKDRQLVQDGPYAISRNPLYLLSVVGALGIGLATRSLVMTIALPLVLAIVFARVVRAEEDLLAALHGQEYASYARSVPRFWPDLSLRRDAGEVLVPAAVYFKAFLDAASFLLLYCLVIAGNLLAQYGLTPALLRLP